MKRATFARTAHGNAKRGGRTAVVESKPWAEQPVAANAAPPIGRNGQGQVRSSEEAARLASLPRPTRKLPKEARAYRSSRAVELERKHGRLSKGVGAMLDGEACAWLAGNRAALRAAETGAREDIAAMTAAFECARALSKDAWSLAAFEAEPKGDDAPTHEELAE
ncbi:MAG TPA: hypothetical protein VGH28_26830 [Polyangiaceae bacterium]|jgi:hypothetical protein